MGNGLYCCGMVHPDSEDAIKEVQRIKDLGLCGIKSHSEYQKFCPDEGKMFPICEKISESELFAVFHGGWDLISEEYVRATPERLAETVKRFPKMTFPDSAKLKTIQQL